MTHLHCWIIFSFSILLKSQDQDTVPDDHIEQEGLVEVEHKENPGKSDSVLSSEHFSFPVHVSEGVLVESGNVLERSPFLGVVSGFLSLVNKLSEIPIAFLSK